MVLFSGSFHHSYFTVECDSINSLYLRSHSQVYGSTGPCGRQLPGCPQPVFQFLILLIETKSFCRVSRVLLGELRILHGTHWYWHILEFLLDRLFFFFSPPRTSCFFSLKVRPSWTQFLTLVPFSEINLDLISVFSSEGMYISNRTILRIYDYFLYCSVSLYCIFHERKSWFIHSVVYLGKSMKALCSLCWGLGPGCKGMRMDSLKRAKLCWKKTLKFCLRFII